MATSPVWLKNSSKDCIDDYDSGDDNLELGLEVYDGYVDKTEASKPNRKGAVETVKVISTHQASKRRRSAQEGSNMTRSIGRQLHTHQQRRSSLSVHACL
jgi:hypothetical protein